MSTPLEVIGTFDGGSAVAKCDRVLITVYTRRAPLAYLDVAQEAGRALGKTYPKRVLSFTLAVDGAGLPASDFRAKAETNMRESDAWIQAGAMVIGGSGFWASAARSVITGFIRVSSGPTHRAFGDVPGALSFLETVGGLSPEVSAALRPWATEVMNGRVLHVG
ncbi:MAG: hypothetical protein U0234_20235 [Sandaracinus sp.]